jgi:hypothetical protein
LRGNSRLKSFKPRLSVNLDDTKRELLTTADAIRENKGLVDLDLSCKVTMTDETWDAVCNSLQTHPTLEVLDLQSSEGREYSMAPAVLKSRIQAILDMVKINLSIHTIHLLDCCTEHDLFRGSVIPYLETNRFRPRLLAIQKTRPITYRAKVLGRALLSARTDANRFWMLLSGNAEVAFPSTTITTTAVTSLPTPAAAAAISTTDAATFAGPVATTTTAGLPTATAAATAATSAATHSTASDAFPFALTIAAADNVASPSPGRKRKALP